MMALYKSLYFLLQNSNLHVLVFNTHINSTLCFWAGTPSNHLHWLSIFSCNSLVFDIHDEKSFPTIPLHFSGAVPAPTIVGQVVRSGRTFVRRQALTAGAAYSRFHTQTHCCCPLVN